MFFIHTGIIVVSSLCLASAVSLRAHVRNEASPSSDRKKDVTVLRAKLEQIDKGLVQRLAPNGPLASSPLAAPFQAFVHELDQTLKDTANATNATAALRRLQDAQAGVQSLMRDMTNRQMELMKEDTAQAQSLLLGVLMTKQKEPFEKQLDVLSSPEFAKLPCVVAVLKNKDSKTPLFQQIAKFLDAHTEHPAAVAHTVTAKGKKPDMTDIIQALNVRVHKIEENKVHRLELNKKEMANFDKAVKNATSHHNTKLAHRLERLKKKEERKFKMEEAVSARDLSNLKEAVDAIEHGDLKKLSKAQQALQETMKTMQAQSNHFIVFIQQAHRLSGMDCPFCVAQCIEKCSNNGNSYTTCLPQCADAGSE